MLAGWLAGWLAYPSPPSLPSIPPHPPHLTGWAMPYVVNGKYLSSRCVHAQHHHKNKPTVFLFFCNSSCCCVWFFLRGLGKGCKGEWVSGWFVGRGVWINKTLVGSLLRYSQTPLICGPFWSLAIAFCLGVALLLSCYVFWRFGDLKIYFISFLLWEFCFQFFFWGGGGRGRGQGFGFCPLLFHGVKCFGGGALFLLLSLSLSLCVLLPCFCFCSSYCSWE